MMSLNPLNSEFDGGKKAAREALLKGKADTLLQAERVYWEHHNSLVKHYNKLKETFSDGPSVKLRPLSSVVWALEDGVALVRYQTLGHEAKVEFRIADIPLQEWHRVASVPTEAGEVLVGSCIGVAHGMCLINTCINGTWIPFAQFALLKYGASEGIPSVESAAYDFQITLIGLATPDGMFRSPDGRSDPSQVIPRLEKEVAEFDRLLDDATSENASKTDMAEERLQQYLTEHPYILHPHAYIIPKKRLGEDLVTDFMLVVTLDTGARYTLVEIERATHPVLTKKGTLSKYFNQAYAQTREWDTWIQKNIAYLREKHPDFESPEYLIVIGRSHKMRPSEKAQWRSYDRNYQDTKLLTYDDLLEGFRSTVQNMKLYHEKQRM